MKCGFFYKKLHIVGPFTGLPDCSVGEEPLTLQDIKSRRTSGGSRLNQSHSSPRSSQLTSHSLLAVSSLLPCGATKAGAQSLKSEDGESLLHEQHYSRGSASLHFYICILNNYKSPKLSHKPTKQTVTANIKRMKTPSHADMNIIKNNWMQSNWFKKLDYFTLRFVYEGGMIKLME